MGDIRIIGGSLRRRKLEVVERPGVRPSPSRVRETLFNWLGQDLSGWAVLDLFSGTGALGFEAASRGASKVVMVDRDPIVLAALKKNRATFGLETIAEIVSSDARAYGGQIQGAFDLVMADPPFSDPGIESLMNTLHPVTKESGFLYLETPFEVQQTAQWAVVRQGRAGQVFYQLLEPKHNED